MKYRLLLITVMLFSIFSCIGETDIITKYDSGNIKTKYSDSVDIDYYDTINNKIFRKQFKYPYYDSIVYYYKNGNVFKSGKKDKSGKEFGNWRLFRKDGYLSETIEYFNVKGEVLANRYWYHGKSGDTLWYATKFNNYDQKEFAGDTIGQKNSTMISFNIYTSDTISLNEPFLASVICNSPVWREHNSEIIMLLAKEESNFNETFSNEEQVKLDTFYNLLIDKRNRPNFKIKDVEAYRYISAFGRYFKTPGKKILRGYMLEYSDIANVGGESTKGEARVYFEKEVYVKEK